VFKKKPIKTNANKKGTKQKNIFFPDVFRGKKLKKDYWLGKASESLEKYLETEDEKYVFQAIKKDTYILEMTHNDYDYYDFGNGKNEEYVDGASIVWISIYHWKFLAATSNPYLEKENVEEAKRLLINVGRALIPQSSWIEEYDSGDIFTHLKPFEKGKHPSIEYKNPYKFIELWNFIYSIFQKYKTKKRYQKDNPTKLEKDIKNGLLELGKIFKINIHDDDIEYLDTSNNRTLTSSFIIFMHENICKKCKKSGLSISTIERLYKKAKTEISE